MTATPARCALAALLVGCAGGPRPDPGAAPARIVSLHDTTTELVVALGATERLAAVTAPRFLSPEAEAAVAGLPRLPGGPVTAEALAALGPDLVLGTDVVIEQQPALDPEMAALGVETWWLDPDGLEGLWRVTREMGARLDREAEADAWVDQARAGLPTRPPGPPVRVFLYDCCDPPFTAGGRAPITELLGLMGAENVFADLDADWGAVSWEAARARDPELIVIHDYAWEGQAGLDEKRARLRDDPLIAATAAGRAGAIVSLPLALALEGPRTLEVPDALGPAIARAREARP